MALPNRMSLLPGLLWLTQNLALIIQCLSWNNTFFFNFTYPLICLRFPPGVRVPQVEYHCSRQFCCSCFPISLLRGSKYAVSCYWILPAKLSPRDLVPRPTLQYTCLPKCVIKHSVESHNMCATWCVCMKCVYSDVSGWQRVFVDESM